MTLAKHTQHFSDHVTQIERVGEFFVAICMTLLLGFFLAHQTRNTGFFTDRFGTLEMILLYLPLLLALTDSLIQVITGHHQLARLFEIASGLLLSAAAVWFLNVFPFDFTHLADVMPEAVRFLFAWITNDIGKIVFVMQIFAGLLGAITAVRALLSTSK